MACAITPASALATPYLPTDDAQVIERLPSPGAGTKSELRQLRRDLAADPHNLDLALRLARRYITVGRAESDPRYNGYAQAALEPWWASDAPPVDVIVLRATLRQNRHEFDAALADLALALARDPRNAQAWLTQAVILQVQGRYDRARRSCGRLALLTPQLVTATCAAAVAGVSGQAGPAYRLLAAAFAATPAADPSLQLWVSTTLAEMAARLGDAVAAERYFHTALAFGERDAYLLGAYADFLLDQGRAREARDLLANETRADPLLLRLALAEQALGAPELADHVATLGARFAASRLRGDTVHRREEARFTLHLLNDPATALRLAAENWQVQREPCDARLLLETALAARRPGAAADVLAWLHTTGLEDLQISLLVQRLGAATPP
jgi:Tfp pilus assembly protein PilF